jgi:hypothetical protein
MSTVKRFSALLYENQIAFLRREAGRYGISENAVLRARMNFAMACGPSLTNLGTWTPQESELRDKLAEDFGLVLSKLDPRQVCDSMWARDRKN